MWEAQHSRRDNAPGAVHQEGVGISLEVFAVPPKTIKQFQFQHLSAIDAQNFLICHLLYFRSLRSCFICNSGHLYRLLFM